LIGSDKQEIINTAKSIGSFDFSILPYSDCCSFLIARHPETKAELDVIKKLEANLDVKDLINKAFRSSEIIKF
jgi:thiamine biosynthesis protein ThiI